MHAQLLVDVDGCGVVVRLVHQQSAVLGAKVSQTVDQIWTGEVKCAVVTPRQEHAYDKVCGLYPVQPVAALNQHRMWLAWRAQEMIVAGITQLPAAILRDPKCADEAATGYESCRGQQPVRGRLLARASYAG